MLPPLGYSLLDILHLTPVMPNSEDDSRHFFEGLIYFLGAFGN